MQLNVQVRLKQIHLNTFFVNIDNEIINVAVTKNNYKQMLHCLTGIHSDYRELK